MSAWLAATLSVIVGGALTMLSAWIADKRLNERERESRREERRERIALRRSDFQRETLLALQEASQKLLRTAGAMHHQDVVAFRQTGRWQRQQLSDDLDANYLQHNTDTMLLASRVRDAETRSLTDKLRTQTSAAGFSSTEKDAEGRMMAAADIQQALTQRIGQLLRELDEAEGL